ncbi:MAG: FUSC family protein [Pseudonocardiaceae bacterium]
MIDVHRCGVAARAAAACGRLRPVGWPIIQTAVAAGLAWYVARTLLGHSQPFFAPIAAAVCLSASTVLRAQRAVQMIAGVTLGISIGVGAQTVAGGSAIAVGLAVLVALVVAVVLGQGFIAQGLMFYNQTAASAILIIATEQTATGAERLVDALIGGGLALVFSVLLFPADPLPLIRDPERAVYAALRDTLARLDLPAADTRPADPASTLSTGEHLISQLAALTQGRSTARQIVRVAPSRRAQRSVIAAADRRAAQLTLLAAAVLSLARSTTSALTDHEPLPTPLREAIQHLTAALTALADHGRAGAVDAAASAQQADHLAVTALTTRMGTAGPTSTPVIASLARACAQDLTHIADVASA